MLLDELRHDLRLRQGGDITHAVVFAGGDLAEDAPHDLPAASLRQAGGDVDDIRGREGTDDLADLFLEGADELLSAGF